MIHYILYMIHYILYNILHIIYITIYKSHIIFVHTMYYYFLYSYIHILWLYCYIFMLIYYHINLLLYQYIYIIHYTHLQYIYIPIGLNCFCASSCNQSKTNSCEPWSFVKSPGAFRCACWSACRHGPARWPRPYRITSCLSTPVLWSLHVFTALGVQLYFYWWG
jgi:hypothetical protein